MAEEGKAGYKKHTKLFTVKVQQSLAVGRLLSLQLSEAGRIIPNTVEQEDAYVAHIGHAHTGSRDATADLVLGLRRRFNSRQQLHKESLSICSWALGQAAVEAAQMSKTTLTSPRVLQRHT